MNKQQPLKTVFGHSFRGVGPASDNAQLCRVNEGIDLCEALQEAANLVHMAQAHSFEIGMGNGSELPDNFAWMTHHALETAEAVILSVMDTLQEAQAKQRPGGPGKGR